MPAAGHGNWFECWLSLRGPQTIFWQDDDDNDDNDADGVCGGGGDGNGYINADKTPTANLGRGACF